MTSSQHSDGGTFNRAKLLESVGGDKHFLARMIGRLKEEYTGLRNEVQDSIDKRDATTFVSLIHRLTGVIANFHASDSVELGRSLELIGRQGDLNLAERPWKDLQLEVEKLLKHLEDYVANCLD